MWRAVQVLTLLRGWDQNTIASAKIVGLTETLNLTNDQYNTCLLMFYVGCMLLLDLKDGEVRR